MSGSDDASGDEGIRLGSWWAQRVACHAERAVYTSV